MSPTGSASGDGSVAKPWDLLTAFGQPATVHPGDTIWARGGIYIPANPSWPSLECYLQGGSNAPIIVRAYPGERPIFQEHPQYNNTYDQTILFQQSGGYVWFWGIEIRSTNTTRYTSTTGSDPTPTQLPLPNSVQIGAPGVKLINMIVHDTRGGMGLFAAAVNAEAYGCIIYNNGWNAPDRGHGHGLYVQNLDGLMHLSDNIIFNQFGVGIHGYSESSSLKHFLVERNIVFNNGRIATYPDPNIKEQILFGGGPPVQDLSLLDNCVYVPLDQNSTLLRLDYAADSNDDVVVANNYVAGGTGGGNYSVSALDYQSVTFTNNIVYSNNGYLLRLQPHTGCVVDRNTYYGNANANFNNASSQYSFAGWQAATALDSHSSDLVSTTPANKVIVNPNAYEPKRANIIVYNWSNADTVSADVSGVLSVGDPYEVRNAQDYFAPPVLTGTYAGTPLVLPMTNLTVAVPTGWSSSATPTTGRQFNVFVLIGSATNATPPQITQQPANQAVLAGQPATFTVGATGTPSLSYQWQRNGSNVSGANSTSYSVSDPTAGDNGAAFRCVVSNAYGTVTSSGATLTVMDATDAPVITAGPIVTNALLQAGNLAVVDSSVTAWLRVDAASGRAGALSYQWTFGDGTGSAALPTNVTSHIYSVPTDCGPYAASVTVSDGTESTTSNFVVAIAYELTVTKFQTKLNFAKAGSDNCSLTGTFVPCPGFDPADKTLVVDIGGAQIGFALDAKGRGRYGSCTCRMRYDKSAGAWRFTAKLKNGTWQALWDVHGLHNTTVPKPGVGASMPVVLLVGDEGFAADLPLIYKARAGKSGSARLLPSR
ncbi:MAG TPA: immunoglobulin domain-containing protein [Verrucomicrobiae bacterium]|nr:immunoglobulin domain-containing protein [Verrucomicrobiae bacterium]